VKPEKKKEKRKRKKKKMMNVLSVETDRDIQQ
jgi:hypothetical protein